MSKVRPIKRKLNRRGLTLHQLLCVLALIPMAPISLAFLCVLYFRFETPSFVDIAKSRVAMLEDAVNVYTLDIGRCPTTSQGLEALLARPNDLVDASKWTGPYLDKVGLPLDPWNNAFHYEATSEDAFRIWSVGPDGQSGTLDDIRTDLL